MWFASHCTLSLASPHNLALLRIISDTITVFFCIRFLEYISSEVISRYLGINFLNNRSCKNLALFIRQQFPDFSEISPSFVSFSDEKHPTCCKKNTLNFTLKVFCSKHSPFCASAGFCGESDASVAFPRHQSKYIGEHLCHSCGLDPVADRGSKIT